MHENLRKTIRLLAPWMLLASLLACGFSPGESEEDNSDSVEVPAVPAAPTPSPAAQPAQEPAAEPAEPAGGGGGACDRVADCCRAYVNTMGASVPASTCDAYSNAAQMPEAACQSAINGYRSGLNAMQKTVPAACN